MLLGYSGALRYNYAVHPEIIYNVTFDCVYIIINCRRHLNKWKIYLLGSNLQFFNYDTRNRCVLKLFHYTIYTTAIIYCISAIKENRQIVLAPIQTSPYLYL